MSEGKGKGGRPSLLVLDPTLGERIAALVRVGNYCETAARSLGVGHTTLQQWMAKAAEHKCDGTPETFCNNHDGMHVYATFRALIEKAEAESETALVAVIKGAAQGETRKHHTKDCPISAGRTVYADGREIEFNEMNVPQCACPTLTAPANWIAAATMLERRMRQRWNRSDKMTVTGPNDGPVQVEDITQKIIADTDKVFERLVKPLADQHNGNGNGATNGH